MNIRWRLQRLLQEVETKACTAIVTLLLVQWRPQAYKCLLGQN